MKILIATENEGSITKYYFFLYPVKRVINFLIKSKKPSGYYGISKNLLKKVGTNYHHKKTWPKVLGKNIFKIGTIAEYLF